MCKYCISLEIPRGKAALGEKGKFWPVGHEIKIAWLGGTQKQRDFVKSVAKEWMEHANIYFGWDAPQTDSDWRISFIESNGSWSYVGTDSLGIPKSRATMNFGWLDEAVVLHEPGHGLGLLHEHQNPLEPIKKNRENIIRDLTGPPNYWDIGTITYNVLDDHPVNQITGTKRDGKSIMMYPWPKEWSLDGFEAGFNQSLSNLDKQFINSLYPFVQEENNEVLEALKSVFLKKKDLSRLSEKVVCRIGDLIGAGTDEKRYWKVTNVQKVWEKLS